MDLSLLTEILKYLSLPPSQKTQNVGLPQLFTVSFSKDKISETAAYFGNVLFSQDNLPTSMSTKVRKQSVSKICWIWLLILGLIHQKCLRTLV